QGLQAFDQRRLGGVLDGDEEPLVPVAPGAEGDRERAAHGTEPAAERELAAYRRALERFSRDLAARRQHADGEREVEARARLAQMRGREVGGDALRGELEPGVEQRRPYALARFPYGWIGQAHDGERRQAAAQVDLDGYL